MKVGIILQLFFIVMCIGRCDDSPVISLDVDSYHSVIDSHSDVVVKHFANFCVHCKELEPIYFNAAQEMKAKYPSLVMAEIDVSENPKIGRELKLQGVPFICYYKNGKRIDYSKGKVKEDIIDFIENIVSTDEETASNAIMQKRADDVMDNIHSSDFVVVIFYPESETRIVKMVDTAMSSIEKSRRITVTYPEVASIMEVPFPSIILYQKDQKKQYKGELAVSSLRRWFLIEELPLIIPYTPTYSKKVFNKELKMNDHIMFFAPSKEAVPSEATRVVERIAKQYRGRMVVLHIPSENHLLLDYFGVKEWEVPTIGIIHYGEGDQEKFLLKEKLTFENAINFIKKFYKGELTRIRRSEEEPVENKGPVYKVVGTTFEQFVFDPTKDVVVRFYASWCGKSKDFEPIYEEVAMEYIRDKSILFTDFEATKNEVEGYNITDFPTVILFKAGGNGRSTVLYSGSFESDDFKHFIRINHLSSDSEELYYVC